MTRETLREMPMHLLRQVNIESKEQEDMVQAELDSRLGTRTNVADINLPAHFTDSIQTKEDELKLQARIDARQAKAKAKLLRAEEEGEPEIEEEEFETEPEVVGLVSVKFCNFCDAPGPFHKKVCTRPK